MRKKKWIFLIVTLSIALVATLAAGCGATSTPASQPTKAPVTRAKPTEIPPTKAPTKAPPTKAAPTKAPAANDVTAAQVQKLLEERFNNIDPKLTLWDIQPGLGTVMMEYARRFAQVKAAADAGDWGLAQYELKEQTEIQEVGEATRPKKADLLKNFEHAYLDPVMKAIEAQDKTAFDNAYNAAIGGCNGCHGMTGHPYIKYTPPKVSPEDFLKLEASKPTAAEEEHKATAKPTPAPDKPLTWQELDQMVRSYFNKPDRRLLLWDIQPGLGTVMMEYSRRFALAKKAADAGDWGLAQYELKEQTEIQEVGETTRPGKAELLKNFEHTYLVPVMKAVEAQDKTAFDKAYADAIEGCNACHAGTGHPYIHFQMPPTSPEPFLQLKASQPEKAEEEEHPQATKPSYPSGRPTLEDAKTLIDGLFNKPDRSLALWNIQPGLGTVMMEYSYRFGNVWAAAEAGQWDLAAYELKEQREIQEVGEVTRPGKAELLKNFEHTYLDPLAEAIEEKDQTTFEKDYKAAVQGCNACHAGTGHPYIHFVTPKAAPATFLSIGQ